jgi:23S rRNA pseudouridine1911/1915/1917 synthase
MAKHIDSELLAILRKFEIAGELSSKKAIRDIKEYPARAVSRLVGFTFERHRYIVLFDNSAGDDVPAVMHHIRLDIPDFTGHLVRNPLENAMKAYGVPIKGNDVYVALQKTEKTRLDHELVKRFPHYTRSTIQKYIKAGLVLVNGSVVTQSKHEISPLDTLSMTPPTATDHSEHDLPIIFMDDNVIVVNKPTGVLTHSKGVMNDEFTVADFFRRYTSFGRDTNRPGIVHRLDRDTSGVIIGARNEETALLLKKQFADRTTKKEYVAVVTGTPKQHEAIIDLPIGRNPSAPSTFRIDPSGKSAQTKYMVDESGNDLSLVTLLPRTGRTHQLRVHMQYIGTPILGDRVYGTKKKADRLYLHAHSLEITLPDGVRTTFTAPTPDSFVTLCKETGYAD